MDEDISFDIQHIAVTDNQSSSDELALQFHGLELDRRLPRGRQACEELLKSPVFQPITLAQGEERIRSQFVFHGQCLVLGDSRVGKSSLVRSLTGKPCNPGQLKTLGIEETLVDKEWKTLDRKKDLAFGKFSSFFKVVFVQLMLFSNAGSQAILVSPLLHRLEFLGDLVSEIVFLLPFLNFILVKISHRIGFLFDGKYFFNLFGALIISLLVISLIWCAIFYLLRPTAYMSMVMDILIQWIRVTAIRKPQLLTISAFLSVMTKSYLGGIVKSLQFSASAANCQIIYVCIALSIATFGVLLLLSVLFLLKEILFKVSIKKWHHPGQYKFNSTKITLLDMISFCGFFFTVFSGYMICLIPLSFIEVNFEFTCAFAVFAAYIWHLYLAKVFTLRLYKLLSGIWYKNLKLALTVFSTVFLSLGLILLPASLYFCIMYVTFFSYTLCTECVYMKSLAVAGANGNAKQNDNVFSAVVVEKAVLDMTKFKSALNSKFSFLKMKVLDFAGDEVYYSYQHLFLRHHALYIIVFNLAEFAKNGFRDISRHIQRLQFWMESICSHVPPRTPILLVGTHRGNMDNNCMKTLNDHLRQLLWNKYCDELVANDAEMLLFFPVENSLGNTNNGIQALQREIISVAEQNKETIGREIPLSWIQIQDAIINFKENPNARFCVTLCEFQCAIDHIVFWNRCICSKEALEYFHEKGLIIYVDKKEDVDLSNWILLKPKILVDIVIQLVTPSTESTQCRGLRHHWGLLQRKGFLTKALLQSIICKVNEDEEAITAFLEQYDLICPLEYKGTEMERRHHCDVQATHFVPSLLPLSADGDKPVWHDHYTDKKFYLLFNNFLPEALFHRLLSRAQKNSNVEFPNGQTVLYRDAGKFWMNPYLSYKLTLMEEKKMIEIAYSSSPKNEMKPSDVLCQVFSMVDGICRRDFPFIKFHCGPACPSQTCPGYQDDFFTSLPADLTDEDSRMRRCHVYNVLPGRQRGTPFLYCENHSFEDELEEWIP